MRFIVVDESVIEALLADVDHIHKYFGVETGRRRLNELQLSLRSLQDAAQDEDLVAAREVGREYRAELANRSNV